MPDVLTQSFKEHSILWVVISAGLGGFIATLLKFLYDPVLSVVFRSRRTARESINRHKYPFIQTLSGLTRSMDFLLRFISDARIEMKSDEYYRMSTLYTFATFLGWCEIIEKNAVFKYEPSSRRARDFHRYFHRLFKAMNSFTYFEGLQEYPVEQIRSETVPRLVLKSIGELILLGSDEAHDRLRPMGYVEFSLMYESDAVFRRYFDELDRFLGCCWDGPPSVAWSRLVILSINARVFLAYLDPRKKYVHHRGCRYVNQLDMHIQQRLRSEIQGARWKKAVEYHR